jgi:hypothetical protein
MNDFQEDSVASDRARISYDRKRNYRSVVAQQGRVTLEADTNEAAWIAGDALRLETIDIVGPEGTPDNGYAVAVSADGTEFVVGAGTMYLGGWRLQLDKAVELDDQPDWLNQPPSLAVFSKAATTEVVALLAIEQSVTAVEDQALREVALGGPDTAARMRLMQHFVQVPVDATSCAPAAKLMRGVLADNGLAIDPKTLELQFDASLRVSFNPPPQPADPCCPPAQGGYLGADNQLVRVTVTEYNPVKKTGKLLWGWNNASFLYRASLVDAGANPQILTLSPAPIDTDHMPQPKQAIEILRTQCILEDDKAGQDCVAALQGQVMTLGAGSVFANNQLTLPQTLDPTYSSDENPLFVRLWQAQVKFTEGQATPLDEVSGLAVTIRMKKLPAAPFGARPYWHFAVRPNTPQQIYPERYLDKGQLPDGPRQWLCDLAVVQAVPGEPTPTKTAPPQLTVLESCRLHFEPLTKQDSCGCCELVLDAAGDWQGRLNAVLNDESIDSISLCFQPGIFEVTNKITFTQDVVKIRGAGVGTVLRGKTLEAVMEFDGCSAVNLSDFSVIAGAAGDSPKSGTKDLQGAITLRDCALVAIERLILSCVDADFRMASCLYAINTVATDRQQFAPPPRNNIRISNCEFLVGHCQVGVLLVNANIARVEGNGIFTLASLRNITTKNIAQYSYTMARLRKVLLHGLTLVDTAAPTNRAARKLAKRQAKLALRTAPKKGVKQAAAKTLASRPPAKAAKGKQKPPSKAVKGKAKIAGRSASLKSRSTTAHKMNAAKALPVVSPIIEHTLPGRSKITHTFGNLVLQFTTDTALTNSWTNAIKASNLNANSPIREIQDTVKNIAKSALLGTSTQKSLNNYVNVLLPGLYSVSSQGIVVAGQIANDIRILNNTIEGTMQGIHVGLSDAKAVPVVSHLQAAIVQIEGNTISLRMTPESNFDRHGIYVGGVQSAWISNNNLGNVRLGEQGQMPVTGIRVIGQLGPRVLIVGNFMEGFEFGIETEPSAAGPPQIYLWKAADNVSSARNLLNGFTGVDNNLP